MSLPNGLGASPLSSHQLCRPNKFALAANAEIVGSTWRYWKRLKSAGNYNIAHETAHLLGSLLPPAIGRPVKWIPSRSDAFLGDAQGRDQNVSAELALDADGKFLALRWTGSHNVGAYIEGAGAIPILFSLKLASTVYDIPAVAVTSNLVFTNTAPTVPYRGAGRPEAVYITERLVDQAAREMRMDPAECARRT